MSLALVLVFPVVLAVVFAALVLATFHHQLHRTLASLRETDIRVEPTMVLPADLDAVGHDLEREGFAVEVTGTVALAGHRQQLVCLLRDGSGEILAELTRKHAKGGYRIEVAFESLVGARVLSTQRVQGVITPPDHLKQVFPGATPEALLAEHRRTLAALHAAGEQPRPIAPGAALATWGRLLRASADEHPSGAKATFRALRIALGRVEDSGSILDRPALPSR